MPVQTQLQQRRGTAASWTSTNPTLAAGEIGFETDTGKFKIGNGSTAWAALAYSAGATAVTYLFNATSGQTTFSGADANGLTLAYTVGAEQVYLNGVLQVRGSDYTATNGTSIVLASGALTSDVLNVIAYSAMTVTDTYTQAQADAKFVQQTNNFFAGKNKIINGDFGIWQRGTSFPHTSGAEAFSADRWKYNSDGSGGSVTISQQTFTPGTAPVTGYEGTYFWRYACTTARTSQTYNVLFSNLEDVRLFAGQTFTMSFWAKASSAVTLPAVYVQQQYGTGGSSTTSVGNYSGFNVTTSWQRFTFTLNMPSISGKTIGTNSYIRPVIDLGTASNITGLSVDIWGVQLENGSIATPFQTATGTLAGELAACQRYYFRTVAGANYARLSSFGNASGATAFGCWVQPPVPMRTAPTAIEYGGSLGAGDNIAMVAAITSIALDAHSNNSYIGFSASVASGLTTYRAYNIIANNSSTAYIAATAEL